jgi:tetratricopeptide (TPR) repeat protein
LDEERIKYKLKLASAFISEGKNLHAIQIYKNLIDLTKREDIYYMLAELYEDMKFIDSGEKILQELIEQNDNSTEINMYLGQYLLRNAKWIDAIEVLNSLEDQIHSSNFLIGYSYLMLNEFELSKDYFKKYISSDEKSELKQEANIYLAKIEYELNNFDSALNYAKSAQFVYSDFWELNLILAKVYYSLDMNTHAVTPIEKALKLNPKEIGVLEFAGKIYFKLEDFKQAEQYFSECIEHSSNISAEIYTLLAKSFVKQKKYNEAKLFFTLALQIDPEYQPAIAGQANLNK